MTKALFFAVAFTALLPVSGASTYAVDGSNNFGSLDPTSGVFSLVGGTGASAQIFGMGFDGFGAGAPLYAIDTNGVVYTINTSTGVATQQFTTGLSVLGATVDPNGIMDVVVANATLTNSWLATVDLASQTITQQFNSNQFGFESDGVAVLDNGVLYTDSSGGGILGADVLYSVDLTTGTATKVGAGNTGFGHTSIFTGVDVNGTVYAGGESDTIASEPSGEIYSLNLATGLATPVTASTDINGWFAFAEVESTPEPSAAVLAGLGLLILVSLRKRLKRKLAD